MTDWRKGPRFDSSEHEYRSAGEPLVLRSSLIVTESDGRSGLWRRTLGGAGRKPGRFNPVDRRTLVQLVQSHAADSPLWQWLREQGIVRPAPSGPTTPQGERRGRRYEVRLEGEHLAAMERLIERYGDAASALRAAVLFADDDLEGTSATPFA